MVRLADLPDSEAKYLLGLECPVYSEQPYVSGPPLPERKVALITTAGLHRRDQAAFDFGETGFRVLPGDVQGSDLIMSHVSVNFDRTGYQQDVNVVFPIDRLRELAEQGAIGEVASCHYSLMGAPWHEKTSAESAEQIAGALLADGVDAVVLAPV